ncbi:MAG: hypothetical protein NTW49_00820 [Bacteroidia bacterium]|nr:hypothetical protein [Bacteroidia bacterium]
MLRKGLIIFIFVYYSLAGMAGPGGLVIKLLNESKQEANPGSTLNLVIQIINSSDSARECNLNITSPSGWSHIMNYNSIPVQKNSSVNKILSFHVSEDARVGDYSFLVEAVEKATNWSFCKIEIPVSVLPRYEFVLKKFESPEYVFAGDSLTINYYVQNLSNLNTDIKINEVNEKGIKVKDLYLAPDSIVITKVTISTDKDIETHIRKNILITASLAESPETQSALTFIYDVIPSTQVKFDPYERYPVKVTGLAASSNQFATRDYAALLDISGDGWLSEKNKQSLSFQFRGPNRNGKPLLGTNDCYFVKYSSPTQKITVGDDNYSLSGLTESSRSGRGARYEYAIHKFNIGAFVDFPRYYPVMKQASAIYAGFREENKYNLQAAYLLKSFDHTNQAQLVSLAASAESVSWGSIESEIASGYYHNILTKAVQSNIQFDYNIFRTFINYTRADKNFPGYFSNTENMAGGITMNIMEKLSLEFQYFSSFTNMALDTMFSNAPFIKNMNASINFLIFKHNTLSLGAIKRSVEDRMVNKLFDFEEDMLRLRLNSKYNRIETDISGEFGKKKNYLIVNEGDIINSMKGNLLIKYIISKKFSFDAFVNYQGNQRYLVGDQKDFYYGGSLNSQWKKLTVSAKYQSDYQIEEYYHDRSILDLSCLYNLNNNHEISLVTNYDLVKNSYNKKELNIILRYTYTIQAPVKRKDNVGSLKGRIINNGVDNVEGIILTLSGNKALTDKDGNFNFPVLNPGESFLFIENSKTGLNSIAEKPGPYKINILPGQVNQFEIAFTRSGKISGKLVIEDDENKDKKDYVPVKEKLENLVVEAKNGEEIFRVITDKDGKFNFEDLRPGNWTVKVYKNGIPNGYEFITDTFNADLTSGHEVNINVIVKKKFRKVKFQEPIQKLKK